MTNPRNQVVRENVADVTDELREKVKSKMDVGKFFTGFITLLLGILLKDHHDSLLSKVGIVFLVSSLGFCVAAVFCYDRLLMPREYWRLSKEDRSEERFQDRLQEEMVRSWRWLFVPAVFCFGAGFLLILADALGLKFKVHHRTEAILLVVLLTAAVVAPIWLGKQKGPKIYD